MITGAARARRLLRDHLRDRVPAKIDALAHAMEVELPPVGEWHHRWVPHEHVNAWPAVMVTSRTARNLGRVDYEDGDPTHRFQWTMRIWVWVRGDGYDETADRVELTTASVVDALLSWPRLADGAHVEDEMSVSFSEIERDSEDRASIAGAWIEALVTMTETTTIPPAATANEILVETSPL